MSDLCKSIKCQKLWIPGLPSAFETSSTVINTLCALCSANQNRFLAFNFYHPLGPRWVCLAVLESPYSAFYSEFSVKCLLLNMDKAKVHLYYFIYLFILICSSFLSVEDLLNPLDWLFSAGYHAPSQATHVHGERRDLHHYHMGFGQLLLIASCHLSDLDKILHRVRLLHSAFFIWHSSVKVPQILMHAFLHLCY